MGGGHPVREKDRLRRPGRLSGRPALCSDPEKRAGAEGDPPGAQGRHCGAGEMGREVRVQVQEGFQRRRHQIPRRDTRRRPEKNVRRADPAETGGDQFPHQGAAEDRSQSGKPREILCQERGQLQNRSERGEPVPFAEPDGARRSRSNDAGAGDERNARGASAVG